MCRALKVLCVASDREGLVALKRAAASAEWEFATGATTEEDALDQLEAERPHVLVVTGELGGLVTTALERYPALRIVADRELPGAAVLVGSLDGVRDAVLGLSRRGPVR